VNLLGGLAMGVLVAVLALKGGADQERWRLLLGVGVLGGFTTFSAFSLEVALMIERRQWPQAFGYSTLSVVLSVATLFAGMLLVRRWMPA
jgi:CrcB protein